MDAADSTLALFLEVASATWIRVEAATGNYVHTYIVGSSLKRQALILSVMLEHLERGDNWESDGSGDFRWLR